MFRCALLKLNCKTKELPFKRKKSEDEVRNKISLTYTVLVFLALLRQKFC